jgi:hypothetical protein
LCALRDDWEVDARNEGVGDEGDGHDESGRSYKRVAGGGGRCDGVDAIEGNSLPRFWGESMGRAKSHNDETWR